MSSTRPWLDFVASATSRLDGIDYQVKQARGEISRIRADRNLSTSGQQAAIESVRARVKAAVASFPTDQMRVSFDGLKVMVRSQAPRWPEDPVAAMRLGRELDRWAQLPVEKRTSLIAQRHPESLSMVLQMGPIERSQALHGVALGDGMTADNFEERAILALRPELAREVDTARRQLHDLAKRAARIKVAADSGSIDAEDAGNRFPGDVAREMRALEPEHVLDDLFQQVGTEVESQEVL